VGKPGYILNLDYLEMKPAMADRQAKDMLLRAENQDEKTTQLR